MKHLLALLILALPLAAQTPHFGTTAKTGAVIDNSLAASTKTSRQVSSDPGTCAVGEKIFNTTSNAEKVCGPVNTWTAQGASSGGSGSIFTINMTQTTLAASTTNAVYGTAGLTTAQNTSTTWSRVSMPAPQACTLKNLYVSMGAAQPSGGTLAITAFVNGADTALTCAVSAAGATCNDTTHTVSIAQGDLVAVHAANNSATGASTYFNVSAVCQ